MALPYKELDQKKKAQIKLMFNSIAHKYDFLNHFLSIGIDNYWRNKAIKQLSEEAPATILDIATGTADFAIKAMKLNPVKITGIDISSEMLKIGRKKIRKIGLEDKIGLIEGDAESMPFNDESFDAVISAFGVRNFENLKQGLMEIYRVLKPSGKMVVLEFSKPGGFFNVFYRLYFKKILPVLGRLFSKDISAYNYLPESVEEFPQGKEFVDILRDQIGFSVAKFIRLSFGICTIYVANK